MVQVASSSSALEADDYLWPFSTIRDTLLRPDPSSIPSPKLLPLLRYHLPRLQKPWQPFDPSTAGKALELSASVTVPRTTVKFDVTEATRVLASKLVERADISPVDAALLVQSYETYALDQPTASVKLDRLLAWYAEEVEAIPGIVLAIQHLCKVTDKEQAAWAELASAMRDEIFPDAAKYMEGLFRGWSALAQQQIEGIRRSAQPMLWSTHQLRHQSALLDLLFSTLYEAPYRPAKVSEGLIRGSILSGFGLSQANREIWETDPECQRLAVRIRDMTLIIAVESMCLNMVVSPGGEINTEGTLLASRDGIFGLHLFILEHSDTLQPLHPEPEKWDFPITPMAVICLAWAVLLGSLPQELSPPSLGYNEGSVQGEMHDRALRLPSGLFPWMEEVLAGPAIVDEEAEGDEAAPAGDAVYRRKVLKDVLIGLSEMLPLDRLQDRSGLYRCWRSLFGGTARTSLTIAADFWFTDASFDERRAILDASRYPLQPTYLPSVLAALSAPASETNVVAFEVSPPSKAFAYMSEYTGFTHVIQPRWYRFIGRDALGRIMIEAVKDIVLPGGERIFSGRRGALISDDDAAVQIVSWQGGVSAWSVMVQILRSAIGLRGIDDKDVLPAEEVMPLSVADLGLQGTTADILETGMKLLASVLRPATQLLPELLDSISITPAKDSPVLVILELALAVLTSSAQNASELSGPDYGACVAAVDILRHLATEPEVWLALRASSFFGLAGRKKGIASALVRFDAANSNHELTFALVKLVSALLANSKDASHADDTVLRASLHTVFGDIWNTLAGWTYSTDAGRHDLIRACASVFNIVALNPYDSDGKSLSVAAQTVTELFITGASNPHYRPLLDTVTDSAAVHRHCLALQRRSQAAIVVNSVEASLELLANLLRLSDISSISSTALPGSIFGITVGADDQIYFVESLVDMTFDPVTRPATVVIILKLLRTYLEVTGRSAHKPSLASMLRDPENLCLRLAGLASADQSIEQQSAAWDLLASMIASQAGIAPFCIAGIKTEDKTLGGPIKAAMDQIVTEWESAIVESPRVVASVLRYLQAVYLSPGSGAATPLIRKDGSFWQAIFDIATRPVPTPPTFTLSMHSEDFALRIQSYTYATQAKASATALLALELDLVLEADCGGEEDARAAKALDLVLGLWRNGAALEDVAISAVYSSANVELHESEGRKLKAAGVELGRWRSSKVSSEREFGRTYLYEGNPRAERAFDQPAVNLAIDMLNLNWSMLETDMALTKAVGSLGQAVSSWAEDDALIAKAAARAVLPVADALSAEERGGSVMLAIQLERLSLLQVIMEAALGDDTLSGQMDLKCLGQLAVSVRGIADSSTFPPVASLRYPDLPALHRPVLRSLFLLFKAASSHSVRTLPIDSALESGAVVVLDAADVVLDSLIRGAGTPSDLGLVVDPLCEIARIPASAWSNLIVESNLIVRSLDLLVRARLHGGEVPAYLPAVLLLHLSLASQPASAEKLAVSGLLPAYSGSLISTEAEYGRIEAGPSISTYSVHAAWCGMLTVIKALLTTLPNTASFVRSDILPFMRVTHAQLLKSLSWDDDAMITLPAMQETELVLELLFSASQALATTDAIGLLLDFVPPSIALLKSIRHALTHPRRFSSLVVPSTEDEQTDLQAELAHIETQQDVSLIDTEKTPILASRVFALLRMVRNIGFTLVNTSQAWVVLQDAVDIHEHDDHELVLESDCHVTSTLSDPVGVLVDVYNLVAALVQKLSVSSPESTAALRVAGQVAESLAILSTAQLIVRNELMPDERDTSPDSSRGDRGGGMDIDDVMRDAGGGKGHSRRSLGGLGGSERERAVWRELEADLLGVLSGDGGLGDRKLFSWLEGVLSKRVGDD